MANDLYRSDEMIFINAEAVLDAKREAIRKGSKVLNLIERIEGYYGRKWLKKLGLWDA